MTRASAALWEKRPPSRNRVKRKRALRRRNHAEGWPGGAHRVDEMEGACHPAPWDHRSLSQPAPHSSDDLIER